MTRHATRRPALLSVVAALMAVLASALLTPAAASAQGRVLGREEILLYGIGLKVDPATQTVPKNFATIVSTYLQAPTLPPETPAFAPDAEVRATLRGPSFPAPIELVAKPNSPFNIPVLTVPGTHTLENIRLVSNGDVLLYGSPETARIDVIEKLLVTTVTTRALTADEIREKGIVYDRSNFQAYNFTAAFAVDNSSNINISFPVLLPTIPQVGDVNPNAADLKTIDAPQLQSLKTLVPDTLQIQARIPNLSVVGFTLTLDQKTGSQDFYVPPIPGVIVIPGDIGFLNQYFSVMLMVANVAPTGSNLVVSELTASIVLPPGKDNVVGSDDDPLAMATRASGAFPRVVAVTQPGPDGKLGTGDDVTTLGPGETGNAEYLVEGRREGTHVVEMELSGTLNGLPVGPVPIRGRAAGAVLVRNPTFTLTFTHPEIVNAGEPYTLDVTVTNTSESPANVVSLNLFPANITGARLDDDSSKGVDSIAPGDSKTVSFRLISNRTGKVTAATLDSDEQVQGRFVLKSAVGELGVPLSPDSFILPVEANALSASVRSTAVDLMARAWAVATAPPAAVPKDLTRFSKQIVLDRGAETAEAGLRVSLGESNASASASLLFDFLGSEYPLLASKVPAGDTSGLLALLQRDLQGFDLVRRRSVRGDLFASAVAGELLPAVQGGPSAFHSSFAQQMTSRPGHVSVLISGTSGAPLGYDAVIVDASGRRLGGLESGKVVKEIPFGDALPFTDAAGTPVATLLVIAVPNPGTYTLQVLPRSGIDPASPFDLSVVLPDASGKLQFTSLTGVLPTEGFALTNGAGDPGFQYTLKRDATGGAVRAATLSAVADPPPSIVAVRQLASADMVGCPLEPEKTYSAGRVVAVLFSEAVTAASVQDKAAAEAISAFTAQNNRVVGVALQPGSRIAYVALRSPVGPFEARTMTIEGVQDLNGNTLATQTLPIQTTVGTSAGLVYGRVIRSDGLPAAFATVRMFYEFNCMDGASAVGVAEQRADASGNYQFDYVLRAPAMNVKLVALDEESGDARPVRFVLARDNQRMNVDVVFIGRGGITGRVYAEDGRTLLPGTALRATSTTDQSQYAATTDANGRYTFSAVPVGNVLIEAVNVERVASVFVSETVPFAGAVVTRDLTLLDVSPASPITRGSITGRVVRADGVTGVANLPVIAYYTTRSQAGVPCAPPPGGTQEPAECAIDVVSTDAQGRFVLNGLPSGSIRLNTFDQTYLQEGTVRVSLQPNQTLDVSVLLGGGYGAVHGVVLDASRRPVPDAVIGGGATLVNAGPDGSFTLTDIPVGRTRLVAVSNALQSQGEASVDIVQNGETVNTTIVLDPIGSVAGIVRDHDGVPQAGIKVWVFRDCYDEQLQPSICINGQATSDAQGAYRIDKLGIGQYTLSAFRADLKDGNVFPIAIRYERQVLVSDITFRGGTGTVTGRVLRANSCPTPPCADTPLPARVSISGDRLVVAGGRIGVKFEYVQNFEVVDNDPTTGEYHFKSGVFTGPFTLRAAGQFSPEPVAAEGTMPGPGQTVTVDLRLQPTSRLTGTVFEADGFTPVTNRQVALKFQSNAVVVICHDDEQTGDSECQSIPQGIQEAFAATDANGQFTFPLVNAGPFTITATDATTGQVASIKGTVRPGDTVDLPVRLLARAPVTVRVFRSNGTTPVLNANVTVQGLDYPRDTRNGIATNGTIQFQGGDAVAEGQFVVTAMDANGFAGRKAGRVTPTGGPVTVDVFLFDATGTVNGQVVKADGNGALVPTPNAEVILSNASGPLAYALTDAQGGFSIPLVPTGPFTIESFDPVTAARGRADGTVLGGPQPVSVTVTLESLGSIRGVVVQSGSRAPLKGWTVQLSQTSVTGRSLPDQIAQTGVDGSFAFPGATVGSFSLRASRRDVVGSATASGQLSRGGQLVDVPMVVDIVRRVTGTVQGIVLNPQGSPAPNAQVEVCPSGEACKGAVAGADGRFSVGDLPLGRFTVRASAQVTGNPSVGTTGGSLLFEGDTANVTITLLGLSSVQGTVYQIVNGARVPAPNATVRLSGQPGSGCPSYCQQGTDGNGQFTFINVPAQTFTVTASSLTGQQGSVGDVLVPGQARSGLEIVLAPAVNVAGRALVGSAPARGVIADLSVNNGHLFAETAEDGTFSFDGIGAGAYTLRLQDPVGGGLARRTGTVNLTGPVVLGDITLDDAAPAVASSEPANGALNVGRTPTLTVTFTEPLDATTVNATTVTLVGPSGPVSGQVDSQTNDTVVRFRLLPGVQLADQARYTLRVTGVQDRVGRPLAADYIATFTTVDITPPAVAETTPMFSATGVSVDAVVRVRFSEIVDPSKFVGAPVTLTGPQGPVAGRTDFLFSNSVVVFTPNVPLADTAHYTVTVQRPTDRAGLRAAADTTFAFDTTDRTPPVILSLTLDGTGTVVQNTTARVRATVAETDIAVVDFFLNDTFAFAARTTPFTMDFKALASLADANGGRIKVSAIATDTSGNRGVVPVQAFLTVVADQPPSIAITQPLGTLTPAPGERVSVTVRATDDVGVDQISYSARGSFVIDAASVPVSPASTDRTQTFAFNVPADAVPGSLVTIQATARDTAAQSTAAAAIALRVRDSIAPTIQITGLSSGQRVAPGTRVTAVVSASDTSGIGRIGFAVSGVTVSSEERLVSPAQSPVVTSFEFTVPANASSSDRVFVDAFAIDGAGNRGDAARLIVPVADRQAPTVTLRTSSGSPSMTPGANVQVIAQATDDLAVTSIQLTVAGAFDFTETRTIAVPAADVSATFSLAVPGTVQAGSTATVTARATDATGNVSTPVSLTLTAQNTTTVSLPSSVLLRAGDDAEMTVTLGTPAPAGGLRVDLTSRNTGIATVPSSVTFAQGETTRSVTVHAVAGGSTQIDAAVGGVVSATTTVTVSGGVVRGDVTTAGPNGFVPVAGAQVTVFHSGTPIVTTTDAQGRFVVEGVQGWGYTGRGFSVTASDGSRLDAESFELDTAGGSATVSLNLLDMGLIKGSVLQPDVQTPAGAGARVDLFEAASPNVVIATTFTDESGAYQFPLVAPGPYTVEASDANGNRGRASAQVTSGLESVVPVVYLGRSTVIVRVLNGVGATVGGAQVQLQSSSLFGSAAARTATTNATGEVSFPDVFVGSVSATATDPFTLQGGSAAGQVTTAGQSVTLTVQFAQYGNLTGTIRRRDGVTPAPGAQVTVDVAGRGRFNATTDGTGVYRFEFLPFAPFTITVFDPSTRGRAIDSGTFGTSGETVTRNEILLPQGALLVTVVDADGAPVNGATVSATTQSNGLTDALQGATGVVNGNGGQVLLDRLLAGSFTVQVSALGLNGSASGVLAADEVRGVTVQLEARATIAGSVFEPDGATPAVGFVRVYNTVNYQSVNATLQGGSFSVPNLRLGTYRVEAYDAANRLRAIAESVALTGNAQTQQVTLTFIGLGTVQGRVLHPSGGDVGNLTVNLRSLNPQFGGYASAQTDAAGNYSIGGIPVGAVAVSSSKPAEQLLGEASGAITQDAQIITLDILLEANAVALPTTLNDVQDSQYGVGQNAGLIGGTGSVFTRGGETLTLSSNGTSTAFTGASFGTREDAGREIAVRQSGLFGLNVTRKVFVPQTGYFARYLEILQNPTAAPVTVDVNLTSKPYGQREPFCCLYNENQYWVAATSSGDTTIDVAAPGSADRWLSLGVRTQDAYYDYYSSGVPLGFAFSGPGAATPVSTASFAVEQSVPVLRYGWNSVTVPANGTIALMHFVSEQASVDAATASAERLAQLPPEALDGLSAAEIAAIANFAVPANGVSAVAPMPGVNGAVSGRVVEGDGLTPVAGAEVTFRSANRILARIRKATSNASGQFSFSGGTGAPVPLDGFTLSAKYPNTQYTFSPTITAALSNAQASLTRDVPFSTSGILKGIVRRQNGQPVAGARVENVYFSTVTTGADGRYFFGGVPAGTPTLRGTVDHPQGTALNILPQTVALAAGQVRDDVLLVEPTGAVTGTVRDADGNIQIGRPITLTATSFSRYTTSDSAGRFTFSDVPVGTFSVSSSDPVSGFPSTRSVAVAADQTADGSLAYAGKAALTVTVTRATGAPIQGMSVTISAPNVNTQTLSTNASGVAGPFNGLPIGLTYTVTAAHPGNAGVIRRSASLPLTTATASTTLTLPAFGTVSATITRPNGTLPGNGVNAYLENVPGSSPSLYTYGTTDATSQISFGVVPAGTPFRIRAYRPPAYQGQPSYSLLTGPFSIATDGQALAVTARTPALASVQVTVQNSAGTPITNARVDEKDVYTGNFQNRGVTDANGRLTVAEVPEGAFQVRAYQPGSNVNVLELAAGDVVAANDGTIVPIVVAARSYSVTVSGTITEHDGATPLGNVYLRLLRGVDGAEVSRACNGDPYYCYTNSTAGSRGAFSFAAVTSTAAGLVLEITSPADYTKYLVPIAPNADGPVTVNYALPVYTVAIQGHVYAADGTTPVPGGVVYPYTFTNRGGFGTFVDPDGSFRIPSSVYPVDGVRLEFNLTGLDGGRFSVNTVPFTQSGQTVSTDIVLPTGTVSTVQGTVVAGDGSTPLDSSRVVFNFGTGSCATGDNCSVTTDAQGRFSYLAVLPTDGQFTARAHSPKTYAIETSQAGTAASQGAVVNIGALTLPISVLSGFATNGTTQPVQDLAVFVRDQANVTTWADRSSAGTFTFYELPAGDYQLTAQNTEAATEATLPVAMPTATSVVAGVQVQLPIVSTVTVTVDGVDGWTTDQASVALVRPAGTFERVLSGSNIGFGRYQFGSVPIGDYQVQVALEVCDADNNCEIRYAAASATVVDETPVDVHLSFATSAQAVVSVQDGFSQPIASALVHVAVQSLAATGPLGSYAREFDLTTDAQGSFVLPYLPDGLFTVRVSDVDHGTGAATTTASSATPAVVEVQLGGHAFALAPNNGYWLEGGGTRDRNYVVNGRGTIVDTYRWDGTSVLEQGAFYRAMDLWVGGNALCCPISGTYSADRNELSIGPAAPASVPGLVATRRLRILQAGDVVRVLDTFSNTTSRPIQIAATYETQPNKSGVVVSDVEPSVATGGYIVRRDDNGQASAFGVVFAGVNAPIAPTLATSSGGAAFSAFALGAGVTSMPVTLTVPAGQSVALLSYVVVQGPTAQAAVTSNAEAIAAGPTADLLAGLTRDDILRIVNFRLTAPPPGPATVRVAVLGRDGMQTTGVRVALTGSNGSAIQEPYTDVNGWFEFGNLVPAAYVVQASVEECDDNGCRTYSTDRPITASADSSQDVVLSLASLGRTTIQVLDDAEPAQPLANEYVEVELQPMVGGPLESGAVRALSVTLDENGAFSVTDLPPGAFVVHVYSPTRDLHGSAVGTATKFAATTTTVPLSSSVMGLTNSGMLVSAAGGFFYGLDAVGVSNGYQFDGNSLLHGDPLSKDGALSTGTTAICCAFTSTDTGAGWLFSPVPVPSTVGVVMTRRMAITEGGGAMRYYDVYTNTSTFTQQVPVTMVTMPNRSTATVLDMPVSPTTGGYFVRADPQGDALTFASIYAGAATTQPFDVVISDNPDTIAVTTMLQLAPGQRAALLHYVLLRSPEEGAGAVTAADALASLSDSSALVGLTSEERALIVNFNAQL
ncbi:MAG: carboxypeptidase regulatory-like domain-containing protein [Acidobacteria bacterium]|nr:carboxypeptidase regulatory-like domain-containing protein [Acidobacteriota bacterium]